MQALVGGARGLLLRRAVPAATSVRHARTVLANNVFSGFVEAVGNTPLIRLNTASAECGCDVYGKAEFMSVGGSVKDRAALWIIEEAERAGKLKPGGVVVEGTAGNTGIGLALVSRIKGYRCVIVIPNTQSQEKKDMLRIAGAELVEVEAKPFADPNNYVKVSGRLAEALGGVWANQFDNTANKQAHIDSTGPEIWAQTKGTVSAFSCAVGTGGTLAGCAEFLRSKNPNVKIGLTDPCGAALFRYYRDGALAAEGTSISEGIGQGRVTANLEGFKPDLQFEIDDSEALKACFDLLSKEGLCVGLSTGINVAGAIRVGKALGPGHTVVTVLCDWGTKYQSRIFNPAFLSEKGLPSASWLGGEPMSPETRQALKRVLH